MKSITIFGSPKTRTFRCLWTLEELGVPYEHISVSPSEAKNPKYLKYQPLGKVPFALLDDEPLFESLAICITLSDHYPEKNLIPRPGTRNRALFEQWAHFSQTELDAPLWVRAKHQFVYPEEKRVKDIIPITEEEYQNSIQVISHALSHSPYLLGNDFTLADLVVSHPIMWARGLKLEIKDPIITDYIDRIRSRTAFLKAKEL